MAKFRKGISGILAFIMLCSVFVCNTVVSYGASGATLWVVGDSTGCHYDDTADATYYYKRTGFGDKLADYFDITVKNLAKSGRSSLSFLQEPEFSQLENIQSGDILLIAFGHNDEKTDANLHTTPEQDIEKAGTFANNLRENYIKKATEKGAKVIICSPIVRLPKNLTSFSDSDLHVTSEGSYVEAAKYTAEQTSSEFIDLTELTKAQYNSVGLKEAANYHAWKLNANAVPESFDVSRVDTTHINNYGAKEVAYLIADAVSKNSASALYSCLKSERTAPSKETDLVMNPSYVEPSNTDPSDAELNQDTFTGLPEGWYASYFGASTAANKFTIANENGNIHMVAKENGGKLASSSVGMAMYYMPFTAGENAQIHAVAHINKSSLDAQASFGAIMTDKIAVNTTDNAFDLTDFVVAAPYNGTAAGYAESAGTGTNGPALSGLDGVDEVNVDIIAKGGQFAVKYGNSSQVFTSDKMTDKMYVGLFVARDADVTFTNIECNGEIEEVDDLSTLLERKNFDCTLTFKNALDSNPVSTASVKSADGSAVNPADGKYNLKDGDVYTVSAEGYVDKKILGIDRLSAREISLTPVVNVTLTETNGVQFTVKDSSGTVIEPTGDNIYALVPGAVYTISAEGYQEQKYTAPEESGSAQITLVQINKDNPQDLSYWFDEQQGKLSKGKYYFDGGIVELLDDFIEGARYTYNNHKSYRGNSSDRGTSGGANVGAGAQTIPDGGTAYSFTPFADGTVKFYGATADTKSYNFLDVSGDAVSVKTLTNSDINTPQTFKVQKDHTYYMLGNSSTGNTQFVGFEYIVTKKISVSGTITKTDESIPYPTKVIFTAADGTATEANVNSADGTFTAELDSGVEYTVTTDSEQLMFESDQKFTPSDQNNTLTLNMVKTAALNVTGTIYGLDDVSGIEITYTKGADAKTATVDTAGKTYTVELEPGTYKVSATPKDGYTLSSLSVDDFTVSYTNQSDNFNNILYKKNAVAATDKTVYVNADGDSGKTNVYATLSEAVAGIKAAQGLSATASDRWIIRIAPGTYREQVIIDVPYVTLTSDYNGDGSSDGKVKLTWYYGVGYKYYSIKPNTSDSVSYKRGYYDIEYAYDRHSKATADRWAATVRVTGKDFRAEDIDFDASFNREYLEDIETADGVEPAKENEYGDTPSEEVKLPVRTASNFADSAATERAAAIVLDCDQAEFRNCSFKSSQDTLYMGQGGKFYFNNCTVQGETDYIFGDISTGIFDDCTLVWAGYTGTPKPGYITAARGDMIFRNCTISKETDVSGATVAAGLLGRQWADDEKVNVIFADTKGIDDSSLIIADGQTVSSSSKSNKGYLDPSSLTKGAASLVKESYCSTDANYTDSPHTEPAAITAQSCTKPDTTLSAADVQGPTYFGAWTPEYYAFGKMEGADNIYEFDLDKTVTLDKGASQDIDSVKQDASITLIGQMKPHDTAGTEIFTGAAAKFTVSGEGDSIPVKVNLNINNNAGKVTINEIDGSEMVSADVSNSSSTAEFNAVPGKSYEMLFLPTGNSYYTKSITITTPGNISAYVSDEKVYKFDFMTGLGTENLQNKIKTIDSTENPESGAGSLSIDTTNGKIGYNAGGHGDQVSSGTKLLFTIKGEGELKNKVTIDTTYNTSVTIKVYKSGSPDTVLDTETLATVGTIELQFNGEAGEYVIEFADANGFYTKGITITTTGTVAKRDTKFVFDKIVNGTESGTYYIVGHIGDTIAAEVSAIGFNAALSEAGVKAGDGDDTDKAQHSNEIAESTTVFKSIVDDGTQIAEAADGKLYFAVKIANANADFWYAAYTITDGNTKDFDTVIQQTVPHK